MLNQPFEGLGGSESEPEAESIPELELEEATTELEEELDYLDYAEQETADSISERLFEIEQLIDKQESRNNRILYAVLFAFLFVIGTMVMDVALFNASNKKDIEFYSEIEKSIYEQNSKTQDLKNCLNISKWLNPECLKD